MSNAEQIFTNDLKKGERVRLANGWEAEVMDRRKGLRRMLRVFGDFTEIGDCYAHDIIAVFREGEWCEITHTQKQRDLRRQLRSMGY